MEKADPSPSKNRALLDSKIVLPIQEQLKRSKAENSLFHVKRMIDVDCEAKHQPLLHKGRMRAASSMHLSTPPSSLLSDQ